MTIIPRSEYPRPQFVRSEWLCLNGEWEFEIDAADSGLERGLKTRPLAQSITVPFCPESSLSGVGHTDFMRAVWYRRAVVIPAEWAGRRVLLHFGAVDYDATIWVNGVEVARHRGGFSPITCVLDDFSRLDLTGGDTAEIVVRARDPHATGQPMGKQSTKYLPYDCFYTRTTGIWQTVWMEPVPRAASLKRPRLTPDVANGLIRLEQPLRGFLAGGTLRARLLDSGGVVAQAECSCAHDLAPRLDLAVPADRRRAWSPADPHLYDVEIELVDAGGEVVDSARSYAGLRAVTLRGHEIRLNGEAVFQRLALDQGYYPDGVMTAPTDEALRRDIQISLDAGFNGARLHQKVFEERFLYHADRMGYLVWGEFADWGAGGQGPQSDHQRHGITYAAQWLEVLERDYSHPCIVGWCALNETAQPLHDKITTLDDATRALFLAAKAADSSRPVLDTSGYSHRVPESDVYDSHDYIEEEPFADGLEQFRERHDALVGGVAFSNPHLSRAAAGSERAKPISIAYNGQPYFVSEFGGFKWNPRSEARSAEENATQRSTSWGYGVDATSIEEFYQRFTDTCCILLENPKMFGYCYTQLYDIYPEENGLYHFDRTPKFDMQRLSRVQRSPAAIETQAR